MRYYLITSSRDPKIIGRSSESQIKSWRPSTIDEIQSQLHIFSEESVQKLAQNEYGLRYDAKVTDVITGVMFNSFFLLVNFNFLKCLNGMNMYRYVTEPVHIEYRNKILKDYYIFYPTDHNRGQSLIDHFRIKMVYKFLGDVEYYNVTSLDEVRLIKTEGRKRLENEIITTKLEYILFKPGFNLDLFYIPYGVGSNLCSARLASQFIRQGVTGISIAEVRFNPFSTIWPNHEDYVAPTDE